MPVNVPGEDWFARLSYFQRLLNELSEVDGDVVECGGGGGKSFAIFASLIRAEHSGRQLWGFDSWQGLPAPTGPDLGEQENSAGIAAVGTFAEMTQPEVRLRLEQMGFRTLEGIHLVQGPLAETLQDAPVAKVALLHIDVDLYRSYLDCLTNLWSAVQPSGIVALDEYHDDRWPGAKLAVDEFLAGVSEAVLRRDALSGSISS